MKLKNTLLIVLLFMAGIASGQQTSSITGMVKDEKNLPLPGATVFLTGTKSITACNTDGKFRLDNVTTGSYEIVVKMVGFNAYVQTVKVSALPLVLNIGLKPNNFLLKEVKIHPDYDRLKHLAIFTKQFLGQTYNAEKCKLVNPDVLFFNYDKQTKILSATADEFLVVQNNALGYKIKYLLTGFEFNNGNNVVSYQGYPSFEEMPGTAKQQALWTTNRKVAYLGSINHFIRAVYNNRVYQEGFSVYKLLNRPMMGIQPETGAKQMQLVEDPIVFDSLLTVVNKDVKSLTFKDCLYVVYKNEPEPDNYTEGSFTIKKVPTTEIAHHGQASLVYLLAPSVEIDNKGLFNPTNGLFFEAYWAWEKNADLMPLEYSATADDKQ